MLSLALYDVVERADSNQILPRYLALNDKHKGSLLFSKFLRRNFRNRQNLQAIKLKRNFEKLRSGNKNFIELNKR